MSAEPCDPLAGWSPAKRALLRAAVMLHLVVPNESYTHWDEGPGGEM
jgi:hypothetical protein